MRERPVASASRERVEEMQRARLLTGAVAAVEQFGYEAATVARITGRARVSRRTFYDLFEDREACLAALVEDVALTLEGELARAGLKGLPWRERVRGGLTAILGFFDREPALGRICMVHASRGGPRLLERRDELLGRLAAVLDEGRTQSARGAGCSALTAEGLVGAAFGILAARLTRGEPLLGLSGELMSMIVLPYLGVAAARNEQARPTPSPPAAASNGHGEHPTGLSQDPLEGLQMRLTYRTARVLDGIAQRPGASNRELAAFAGIQDQGQASKLLARLERLGLVVNGGEGHARGERNAWTLTGLGGQVAERLAAAGVAAASRPAKHRAERPRRAPARRRRTATASRSRQPGGSSNR
jgi:AcrR family transcriptional regulator